MLWQAAYSEFVFTDVLWPDVDRRDLWAAIDTYARRDRRYGGALPNCLSPSSSGEAGLLGPPKPPHAPLARRVVRGAPVRGATGGFCVSRGLLTHLGGPVEVGSVERAR